MPQYNNLFVRSGYLKVRVKKQDSSGCHRPKQPRRRRPGFSSRRARSQAGCHRPKQPRRRRPRPIPHGKRLAGPWLKRPQGAARRASATEAALLPPARPARGSGRRLGGRTRHWARPRTPGGPRPGQPAHRQFTCGRSPLRARPGRFLFMPVKAPSRTAVSGSDGRPCRRSLFGPWQGTFGLTAVAG